MENRSTDEAARAARASELRHAYSQKSQYETRRGFLQCNVTANDEKIQRLECVRQCFEAEKAEAESRKSSIKDYAADTGNFSGWSGSHYTKASESLENKVVSDYADYINRLDRVLDAVCDEITRLQNDNYQMQGDILHIASLINSIINRIRTLTN